jgi:flagellar basal-body rod protein FlgG
MLEGLRTAAAGMRAQQDMLDAVSNDLANANTNGYKRQRVGFADLLYQQGGRPTTSGIDLGTGARVLRDGRTFEQGALKQTDNPLDVAVQGDGFIKVKLPDGRQALSRDGALHLDGDRRLVNGMGAMVQPEITVPEGIGESQISIGKDGTVAAGGKTLGKIGIATVRSVTNLESVGESNAFVTTATSGPAIAAPTSTTLTQGAVEASNTDMAQAMTDLITTQRSYQMTSKAIQTADQMMEIANQVKR